MHITWAQLATLDHKCIWVQRESMYRQSSIDSALTYAANQGFNQVFVQVRARGDALYRSDLVEMNPKVAAEFDPLAYAVMLGHKLGLEIHAWMNMYILWSSRTEPEIGSHLYYTRPEWTEANHFGKMDWRIDVTMPPSPDWEGIYLAPLHPDVNIYLSDLIEDVALHYQVDGIHLDYLRYQDDYYGYNPRGRELFRSQHDIDPMDIARGIISTRFGWEQAYVDSVLQLWQKHKQKGITDLLQKTRYLLDQQPRKIVLSAAVKPNINTALTRWSQDWPRWIEEGLLDYAVPMNYYREIHIFSSDIKLMKQRLETADLKDVIMGIGAYNQDAQSVSDKVYYTRLQGIRGISVFSYDSHKNHLSWYDPVMQAMGTKKSRQ